MFFFNWLNKIVKNLVSYENKKETKKIVMFLRGEEGGDERCNLLRESGAHTSHGRDVDARRAISGTVDSSAIKQCKRVLLFWLFLVKKDK